MIINITKILIYLPYRHLVANEGHAKQTRWAPRSQCGIPQKASTQPRACKNAKRGIPQKVIQPRANINAKRGIPQKASTQPRVDKNAKRGIPQKASTQPQANKNAKVKHLRNTLAKQRSKLSRNTSQTFHDHSNGFES